MYKLKCSHISNEKYINKLESDLALRKKYLDLDSLVLSEIILNDEITPQVYTNSVLALSVADEFRVPMLYSEVKYLFFALLVNRSFYEKETRTHINTLSQAKLLFDETGNSFTELNLKQSENKMAVRFERFMARHRNLFPNCNLFWEIPISFYKDGQTGQQCVTPAGNVNPYALVSIPALGTEKFQIPRSIYLKFFLDAEPKLICHQTKEIALSFNQLDSDRVLYVLQYCGYHKRYTIQRDENTDYYYDNESNCLVAELLTKDSKVAIFDDANEEEKVYWSKLEYNKYFFLKSHKEYVPVLNGNQIDIYIR